MVEAGWSRTDDGYSTAARKAPILEARAKAKGGTAAASHHLKQARCDRPKRSSRAAAVLRGPESRADAGGGRRRGDCRKKGRGHAGSARIRSPGLILTADLPDKRCVDEWRQSELSPSGGGETPLISSKIHSNINMMNANPRIRDEGSCLQTAIIAQPAGALIRTPTVSRPPARFHKKLAAWERSNGRRPSSWKKEPPRSTDLTAPASSRLHDRELFLDGVILVTYSGAAIRADSRLIFRGGEEPERRAGARAPTTSVAIREAAASAESITAAELLDCAGGYRPRRRLEIVRCEGQRRAGARTGRLSPDNA